MEEIEINRTKSVYIIIRNIFGLFHINCLAHLVHNCASKIANDLIK